VIRIEQRRVVLRRLAAGQRHRADRRHPDQREIQTAFGADFAEQPHHARPGAAVDRDRSEARDHGDKAGLEQGTKTIKVSWAQPSSSPDNHHDRSRRMQAERGKGTR
jgi:hypothetical protein